MAEEFQGGVCGENWPWNSSRNLFASSPCSLATNDIGSFWWPNHDLKAARSSDDSDGSGSVVIQAAPQPLQTTTANSTFQMTGISLSSDDCYQDLLHDSGRSIESYSNFLLDPTMDYQCETIEEDSWIHSFKQVNQMSTTPLQQQQTSTYQSNCFPMDSASYTLLQALFDTDCQPQKSLLDNQAMNYPSSNNHQMISSNGFLPETSPMANQSFPTQQPSTSTNNASLCHAMAAPSTFLPSSQSHFLPSSLDNKNPNLPIISSKHQHEEGEELASVAKKGSNEAAYKRQRIETPSPLPTFKVRKEKLGDRITALQQLVSPFGKTDTASVLHEAIDYIKFLHDQVNALSTPYLTYGSPPLQRQQGADISTDQEGLLNGLKSRGLCLVPISSTFPFVARTPLDLWTV